jgi:hypothetical protein
MYHTAQYDVITIVMTPAVHVSDGEVECRCPCALYSETRLLYASQCEKRAERGNESCGDIAYAVNCNNETGRRDSTDASRAETRVHAKTV